MTAGALLVGYGLSKFSGNMPRKYEIVRLMNRSSLTEVCKRAADLGFGSSNYGSIIKFVGFRVSDILPSAFIHYL